MDMDEVGKEKTKETSKGEHRETRNPFREGNFKSLPLPTSVANDQTKHICVYTR